MTDLSNELIKETYANVLQVDNAAFFGLDGTLRTVQDLVDKDTPLSLAQDKWGIDGIEITPSGQQIQDVLSSTVLTSYTADSNFSQYSVLKYTVTGVDVADITDSSQLHLIAGIATEAGVLGNPLVVSQMGLLTNVGWSWVIGTPIFFDNLGQLTQTAPTTGFTMVVGIPVSATVINVRMGTPVRYA